MVEQHTDPAFIAYIKGEIPDNDAHCWQTATEKVESHHLKKTTREKNNKAHKVKKDTPTCQKRSVISSKAYLRMMPPPVEELVLCRLRSFISTDKGSPGSTEPPRREFCDKRNFAGEHQSHELNVTRIILRGQLHTT